MPNQLISETLLDRREDWQNQTIIQMQEKLNSHPAGRYVVTDYKTALVVVYGNTQIGKTSLILNLMGVSLEHQREVYSVLRAKQEYGDSSTVTAIIYLISPTDRYGISFSDSKEEIEFCDEKEMIQKLCKIRDEIEGGKGEEQILYIFIPRGYFSHNVLENEPFSVMDLPGINSKNELERDHVDDIVARYMSMATVKMVVTKGDSIQNLENITVPEGINWKAFPNKYFVVVTMAFSQGSVKKYFDTKKQNRTKSFAEYIKDAYKKIPEIIQSDEMEWYPIDVGESYRNLLNDYPEEADEIENTQEFFTKQIRQAVLRRKGNGLHNIIEDLTSYSKDYYRVNIERLKEKRSSDIKEKETKENDLDRTRENKKKYVKSIDSYLPEEINQFSETKKYDLIPLKNTFLENLSYFVYFIENNYSSRIKDHDLFILKYYIQFVDISIASFCKSLRESIGDELFENMYPDGISRETEALKEKIEMQKLALTKLFRPSGISFLFEKVDRTKVVEKINEMANEVLQIICRKIDEDLKPYINEYENKRNDYFRRTALNDSCNRTIESLNSEIEKLSENIENKNLRLKDWEKKEKSDESLLKEYLSVAEIEYRKSKEYFKYEMKGKTLSEKLQYLVLLGLMEEDYNMIVEGKKIGK